jgi:hypothetical protein
MFGVWRCGDLPILSGRFIGDLLLQKVGFEPQRHERLHQMLNQPGIGSFAS